MEDIKIEPKEENLASPEVAPEVPEGEPKKRKKLKAVPMPKLFKNKIFVFSLLTFLTGFGIMLLFFSDTHNAIRDRMGIKPESVKWLTNIFKMDVSIITYLVFLVLAIVAFFVMFSLLFRKNIKDGVEGKYFQKTGKVYSKKGNIIFQVVYWVIFAIVIVAIAFGLYKMFALVSDGFTQRASAYKEGGFGKAFARFLGSSSILLLSIASIPLFLLLLFLIYKTSILLFGGVAGGVARSVMQSTNFQETYAAAQAASNKINEMANQLPKSISVVSSGGIYLPAGGVGGEGGTRKSTLGQSSYDGILFPALDAIDKKYVKEEVKAVEQVPVVEEPKKGKKGKKAAKAPVVEEKKVEEVKVVEEKPVKKQNLSILVDEFQSYLASEEKLYFSKNVLRTFIAGMSASRLILLEGLSGTGKSSLPRKFQDFIGGRSCFLQVQATWRDRTDVLGYFSDLTGYYKETELLKSVYESSYTPHDVNMIVLDEMNISRAEYYFADFLSIYEYPSSEWKIQLMQTSSEMKLPKNIPGGTLQIPTNTWFIGTINVDDSTFTVTDKVYDRAIVINFNAINEPFEVKYTKKLEPVSYEELTGFFEECQSNQKLCLNKEEKHAIFELLSFLDDTFEIKVGNRIFNQIELFVPVFVGLGGTKLDALDMMISAKILRKLDLVFIMDMADSLIKLQRFLNNHFKKDALPLCRAKINSLLKKYQ